MRQKVILVVLFALYVFGTLVRTHTNLHPWEFTWVAWVLARDFTVGCFFWILHGVVRSKRDSQGL